MTRQLSAVVVNYRSAEKSARCVATLRAAFSAESIDGEVILVDCGSPASESRALDGIPADARVLLPETADTPAG